MLPCAAWFMFDSLDLFGGMSPSYRRLFTMCRKSLWPNVLNHRDERCSPRKDAATNTRYHSWLIFIKRLWTMWSVVRHRYIYIYISANEDVLFTRTVLVSAHWEPPAEKKMTPSCLCRHISLKHCHIRWSVLVSEGTATAADDRIALQLPGGSSVSLCGKWIQCFRPLFLGSTCISLSCKPIKGLGLFLEAVGCGWNLNPSEPWLGFRDVLIQFYWSAGSLEVSRRWWRLPRSVYM